MKRSWLFLVAALCLASTSFVIVSSALAWDSRITRSKIVSKASANRYYNGLSCKEWVKRVFSQAASASGSSYRIGSGYYNCYKNVGGVRVDKSSTGSYTSAKPGDIIQIYNPTNPDTYKNGYHTAIVLQNYGTGTFQVMDSNFNWDYKVNVHNWNPYTHATKYGLKAGIWRVAQ